MAKAITTKITETGKADQLLGQLPAKLRGGVLKKAVRSAGAIVARSARQLCPVGVEVKKGRRLRDTITTVTRSKGQSVLAVTGPRYGIGLGNHSHLVEFGHAKVLWGKPTSGFVRAKPFLRPAADQTLSAQQSEIINKLKAHVPTIK